MGSLRRILLAAAVLLPAIALLAVQAKAQAAPIDQRHRPEIHRMRGASAAASSAVVNPQNMMYFGGAVLPSTTTYAIWWGKPSDFPADARNGLDDFLEDLEGSDYLRIADQYMLGNTAHTRFGGNLFDPSAPTSTPVDAQGNDLIYPEVFKVLDEYGLKPDPTAIYVVYTSNYPAQAAAQGFCAFHTYDTSADGTFLIHLAYVPNTTGVPSFCGTDFDPLFTPNIQSEGTRAITSATAHEFMETITDPNGDAWYNLAFNNEIGDPCDFIYQSWVPLRDSRSKIQGIWSNQTGGCVQGAGRETRVLGATSSSNTFSTFDIPAATYGTFAQSINAGGAMAGYYNDANNIFHSFVRDKDRTLTTFDPPVAVNGSSAYGINEDGEVAGYYWDTNFVRHGFVRDKFGTFTTFDASAMSGTSAYGINNDGSITGKYRDADFVNHGYVRDKDGAITTFDPTGAGNGLTEGTWPSSINADGAVTGYFLDPNSVNHGFVREKHGVITTFDAPGASSAPGGGTFAYSINDEGAIVGHYTDAAFRNHAYVRDEHGLITTFDAPGAIYGTFAYSINKEGAIAGYYSDASGFPHGFTRDKHGDFTKIDTPGKSYGTVVLSINNEGAVAGYHTAPTP
jgi:uncharacterized membrane protein